MRFLNNLNAGLKISLLAVFLLTFLLGMAVIGMVSSKTIKNELDMMYDENLVALSLAKEAKVELVATSRVLLNMAVTKDPNVRKGFISMYDGTIGKAFTLVGQAREKMASPQSLELVDKVASGLEAMRTKQREALAILTSPDAELEQMALAPGLSKDAAIRTDKFMSELCALLETEAQQKIAYSQGYYEKLLVVSGIFLVLAFVLGAGMSLLIRKAIAPPLEQVSYKAGLVAAGDLDQQFGLNRSDEIGSLAASLDTMVETLRRRLTEAEQEAAESARQSALAKTAMEEAHQAEKRAEAGHHAIQQASVKVDQVVNSLFSEIAALSGQVANASKSATTQSEYVMASATAMEEMNNSAQEVARNAEVAAVESESARSKAKEGENVVSHSLKAITTVQEYAGQLKVQIEKLGEKAMSIGTVLTVITDIADQTNLLALNAAIEAARAGEAGRGFSVVADEVRKLAEKTMVATSEVGNAIKAIQQDSNDSIAAVEKSVESLDRTVELISQSGGALADIVAFSDESANQVRAIATAANAQSTVSQEVTKSLSDINYMAEKTVSAMKLSTDGVSVLSAQASELQQLVAELRK